MLTLLRVHWPTSDVMTTHPRYSLFTDASRQSPSGPGLRPPASNASTSAALGGCAPPGYT